MICEQGNFQHDCGIGHSRYSCTAIIILKQQGNELNYCPISRVNFPIGYFWSSGDLWRSQRKFGQGVLRHLSGPGQQSLRAKIQREAGVLCSEIARLGHHGAPVEVTIPMNYAVANVMCSLVFGKRFQYDETEFQRIMELSFDIQQGGFSAIENFVPSLYKYKLVRLLKCLVNRKNFTFPFIFKVC